MKILLTGVSGFIGSNLASHLLNSGHQVLGFDANINPSIHPTDRIKQKSGKNWKNFKFYQVDIRDMQSMISIAVNERPDCVVHLAALGSVPRSFKDPALVCDINERGFINVMNMASMLGCERFVFASSSSVYGDHKEPLRIEDRIGNAKSPYALTKQHNEKFAKIWCENIDLRWVGLRFFNVYGDGQLLDSPYSAVIPRFINGKEITIYGDGETTRDFSHVDDVCEAIELSLTTHNTNDVYNVGTGNKITLNQLAKLINEKSAVKKEIKHYVERPADTKHSVASTLKAESLLKFKASVNIEEGIERTIAYYEGLRGIHNL